MAGLLHTLAHRHTKSFTWSKFISCSTSLRVVCETLFRGMWWWGIPAEIRGLVLYEYIRLVMNDSDTEYNKCRRCGKQRKPHCEVSYVNGIVHYNTIRNCTCELEDEAI